MSMRLRKLRLKGMGTSSLMPSCQMTDQSLARRLCGQFGKCFPSSAEPSRCWRLRKTGSRLITTVG